jgi:aminoglycoside 6'-N-acetyltransferase
MRAPRSTFTPLREEDLPLVRRWLLEPHVRRWWDDGVHVPYPDAVIESYRSAIRGEDPSYHYIAYIDGRPAGMFQHYRVADHPEYAEALALDEDAIGVDLFIGEPDLIGKGHGPNMLRDFLRVAFTHPWDNQISVCVIGPSLTNVSAIRAYEKAGFRFLRDVSVPGEPEPEHLMRLTRADLDPVAASPMQ